MDRNDVLRYAIATYLAGSYESQDEHLELLKRIAGDIVNGEDGLCWECRENDRVRDLFAGFVEMLGDPATDEIDVSHSLTEIINVLYHSKLEDDDSDMWWLWHMAEVVSCEALNDIEAAVSPEASETGGEREMHMEYWDDKMLSLCSMEVWHHAVANCLPPPGLRQASGPKWSTIKEAIKGGREAGKKAKAEWTMASRGARC